MEVTFKRLVGPEYMVPAMRVTTGKDMYTQKMPSLETWHKMILSEHSSHRSVVYRVYIEDIPFYNHVHLVRHSQGVTFNVYSQRDDEGIEETTLRDEIPQGTLINMFFDANVQALINIARKRLCHKSHRTTQNFVKKLKMALIYNGDDYDKLLGELLMKPCSWWPGLCSEPQPCGKVVGVQSLTDLHKSVLDGVEDADK